MNHDRAWIATRKGLFELRRDGAGWRIERISFLGEPVSMLLPPQDDARMLAALNLGHFGVKLHASDDAGANWHEVATPTYPDAARRCRRAGLEAGADLVAGGARMARSGPARCRAGCSARATSAQSWQLVESLWQRPERAEWFGGGYDVPGIHSICPHPQRAGEVLAGISCGGVWVSRDDGADWALQADGMRAAYMPPEQADSPNTQDPHRIVRCAGRARGAVVPASQRHLALDRQRAHAGTRSPAAPVSSFGFARGRASRRARHGLVRAGAGRRMPRAGGWRAGGQPHARRRQELRDAARRPAAAALLRPGLPARPGASAPDGRTLLMGSTTGGLWGSVDAGDTWQAVSAHLPPIYAVRFG